MKERIYLAPTAEYALTKTLRKTKYIKKGENTGFNAAGLLRRVMEVSLIP